MGALFRDHDGRVLAAARKHIYTWSVGTGDLRSYGGSVWVAGGT